MQSKGKRKVLCRALETQNQAIYGFPKTVHSTCKRVLKTEKNFSVLHNEIEQFKQNVSV